MTASAVPSDARVRELLSEALGPSEPPSAPDSYAQRILDAAQAQILEFGLRRSSVEDIAARAGVNRATIYRRFGDREGLAAALLHRETQRHFERLAATVDDSGDPFSWIVEGLVYGVGTATGDPLLRRLVGTDPSLATSLVSMRGPIMSIAVDFVRGRIEQLQASGRAAPGDAGALAEAGFRIVHSLVLDPTTRLPIADPDDLRAFARRALIPMITGRTEA